MSNDIGINGLGTFREEYRRYAARGVAGTEAAYTPDDVRALLNAVRDWAEARFSESRKLTLFSNDYEAGRCVGQEDVYSALMDLLREDDICTYAYAHTRKFCGYDADHCTAREN